MGKTMLLVAACAFCFAGAPTIATGVTMPGEAGHGQQPQPVLADAGPRWPLAGDDEDEIIAYLDDHAIPDLGRGFTHAGPPITLCRPQFRTGSPRLRLAIAKALTWAPEEEIAGFWQACGSDDVEAKHYLVGLALTFVPDQKKGPYRRWLIEEGDLEYAEAIAGHLYWGESLFSGTDEAERAKLLSFLDGLFRRLVKNNAPEQLQINAIQALSEDQATMVVVTGWLADESRKVSHRTLAALWEKRVHLKQHGTGAGDKDFFDKAARNQALVDAWCLWSPKGGGGVDFSPFEDDNLLFQQNVWKQVFSEDDDVRRGALRYLCRGGGRGDSVEFIQGLDAPLAARERALADARAIYDELRASKDYVSKSARAELDKRFEALSAALQPQ
jgi:hypothetical protein